MLIIESTLMLAWTFFLLNTNETDIEFHCSWCVYHSNISNALNIFLHNATIEWIIQYLPCNSIGLNRGVVFSEVREASAFARACPGRQCRWRHAHDATRHCERRELLYVADLHTCMCTEQPMCITSVASSVLAKQSYRLVCSCRSEYTWFSTLRPNILMRLWEYVHGRTPVNR